MSLSFVAKESIILEVAEIAKNSSSVIASNYSGLNVAQMTQLRRKAREKNVCIRVVRNTLARRAFENTDYDCICDSMKGALLLAFSQQEPNSAAAVINDFAQDNPQLEVKLVVFDGQLLSATDIKKIAAMPTLDEARAMLLGVLKAPLTKFVGTLSEPQAGLLRTLLAHSKKG